MQVLSRRWGFLLALAGVTLSNIPNLLYIVGDAGVKYYLTLTSIPVYAATAGAAAVGLGMAIFLREVRKEPTPPLFSWRARRESFL